jgi:hypothetical protein
MCGRNFSDNTLNTLTLGTETKTEQTRSFVMQLCLLHSGCKITAHFFMLSIWAFHHYSIVQTRVSPCRSKKKKKYGGPVGTLIWDLSPWIFLFSLIAIIPFIFNIFFYVDPNSSPLSPNDFPTTDRCGTSLISHFLWSTHFSFPSITTRNQDLQASINHVISEIGSTNSHLAQFEAQVEHKFDTMEAI